MRQDAPLWLRLAVPLALALVGLALWQGLVVALGVRPFVLPAPAAIWQALLADFPGLMGALWVTLRITALAFAAASVAGVALAVLCAQSRLIGAALFPYAVMLQVTPVVAIAPLLVIWVGLDHVDRALLILAALVAFFPILSNTTLGLRSVDRDLLDLMALYGASRWQRLWMLQFPSALPYLLGAMRISGGLALIGAVVAEFVAGSGADPGLAWSIIESGNRLQIPRMFAALFLLSALGVTIFLAISLVQHVLLRNWHESARRRGR